MLRSTRPYVAQVNSRQPPLSGPADAGTAAKPSELLGSSGEEGHLRQGSQGSPGASSTAHRELERLGGRRLGSQRASAS